MKFGAVVAVAILLATACGSSNTSTGTKHRVPPTATLKPLDKVGDGEGALNLIAWEGYVDDSWKKPCQDATGCQVNAKFKIAPTSWSAVDDTANKGIVTAYDYPITIADAALYLSKSQPSLGITDPYELTKKQFDATVALLMQQRQLIKKYWPTASEEILDFQNGDAFIGAAWPYQTIQLKGNGGPFADTIPSEGATGWGDTWMLATKAPHPNCAHK